VNRLALTSLLTALVTVAACDTQAKTQLRELAHADSLRRDSIVAIKNEMLNEVMASTQFLNDINTEMSRLRTPPRRALGTALASESELSRMREERDAVRERIAELVSRLDSSEARLASLRERATSLSARDRQLTAQVAEYEKTIGDLRSSLETQRAEFQAIVDRQNLQIAQLNQTIDTVTRANVQLTGQRAALADTVSQLVSEINTAYYVIGRRDELIKAGILVEEGRKRLLVLGSRNVAPARELDPEGEYTILSRQNLASATPEGTRDGRITGGLRIDDPARFWEASPFLVIVRN
jgi:chromosome segregation ATPase